MPRILKATEEPESQAPAPFAFDDLGQHARWQLEEARREAEAIIAAAEAEATEIRRRAQEEAQLAAERTTAERLDQELRALVPALRATATGLAEAKAAWLAHWECSAVKLSTAIAARVIRREVKHAPEISLVLVREALELAVGNADVQLRMHPADAQSLAPQIENLIAEIGRLGQVSLVADGAISSGGCRVETRHGVIDHQFEAQLDRIAAELS
jgi:flagellar assembly protein FliH